MLNCFLNIKNVVSLLDLGHATFLQFDGKNLFIIGAVSIATPYSILCFRFRILKRFIIAIERLSLKQGTGNRGMGMGNGERGTGNL